MWRSIFDGYQLEAHEELTLLEACGIANRLQELNAAQASAELTTTNSRGDVVASPYLEARQQQVVFLRTLAPLRLPTGGEEDEKRPQRRGGARDAYSPRAVS